MLNKSIHVYLDSSDYSLLSNPNCQNENTIGTRKQLLNWANTGQVKFLFSGVHLSEMAPVEAFHTPSAAARADLLVELCGRNALISFDRLLTLELSCIFAQKPSQDAVRSTDAYWFPELTNIVSPVEWANAIKDVDEFGKRQGFNRHNRRAMKRKLFKNKKPTKETLRNALGGEITHQLDEFLKLYPMRPSDAKVIWNYILGAASANEVDQAFLESLRDPRWMMRWFADHHTQLSPIIESFREPSSKLIIEAKKMAYKATELGLFEENIGIPKNRRALTKQIWIESQDEMVVNVASSVRAQLFPDFQDKISFRQFDQNCPGFSACLRSLHSSIWSSIGKTGRILKDSDVVDAVHAMYAPYVDIFRADRFMAPFIGEQVSRHGTIVVSKLDNLVPIIQKSLSC